MTNKLSQHESENNLTRAVLFIAYLAHADISA